MPLGKKVLTPSSSLDGSDGERSPPEAPSSPESVDSDAASSSSGGGAMLDRGRMVLCMALLAIFVVNPLAPLVTPTEFDYEVGPDAKTGGKTIMGIGLVETGYSW